MPVQIVRQDITKMEVDAVVNAANQALKMGGGVCGDDFYRRRSAALQTECDRIGKCQPARRTSQRAGKLPAQ